MGGERESCLCLTVNLLYAAVCRRLERQHRSGVVRDGRSTNTSRWSPADLSLLHAQLHSGLVMLCRDWHSTVVVFVLLVCGKSGCCICYCRQFKWSWTCFICCLFVNVFHDCYRHAIITWLHRVVMLRAAVLLMSSCSFLAEAIFIVNFDDSYLSCDRFFVVFVFLLCSCLLNFWH